MELELNWDVGKQTLIQMNSNRLGSLKGTLIVMNHVNHKP